ncbi:MAG: urea ABC transporter ATP-binding subunit UrtE [Betaproteobacteria bacterium]
MLEIEGLNQYYGGSHILREVQLCIPDGQCTVLLGRNGVGKTTLLKCLMGVLSIRTGRMRLAGEDITALAPHRRAALGIGYVPQGREIFNRLTVEENLRMGLAPVAGSLAKKGIPEELFAMFPVLKQMLHRRGGDLSGGQQQQLAIARALAARPRLLILDEPTEGIQPSIIKEIREVIRSLLARGGIAVLLVEQYYDFAAALAGQYAVMSRGQVIRRGEGSQMEADGVRQLLTV